MAKLIRGTGRAAAARLLDPLARVLLRWRISPDAVTVAGTVGVVAAALGFGTRGMFVPAALVVGVFALVDLVDGAMARARGYGTRFGALLDSTLDRVADGAIFGAIAYWYASQGEPITVAATLVALVGGQVTSYVKARAGSLGIDCPVGLVERPERLMIVGAGTIATGLGVGWALPAALWALAALSLVTVAQRVWYVRAADRRRGEREPAG